MLVSLALICIGAAGALSQAARWLHPFSREPRGVATSGVYGFALARSHPWLHRETALAWVLAPFERESLRFFCRTSVRLALNEAWMTTARFTPIQILFHWLSALLVLAIIALPYGADYFASLLGGKGNVFTLHKSLGVLVLGLTLLRLLYRGRKVPPQQLEAEQSRPQQYAAMVGHGLLYLLLLMMPISGLLFGSKPINLFWLTEIGPLPFSSGIRGVAKDVHLVGQYLLFALILGHAAIALWHHYVRRDDVLKGMLPLVR